MLPAPAVLCRPKVSVLMHPGNERAVVDRVIDEALIAKVASLALLKLKLLPRAHPDRLILDA